MIDSISSTKAPTVLISDVTARANAKPETTVSAAKPQDIAPLSPRLRPDFLSGAIVTEFVGNNGQVTQQTPTVAALAYLRAGLDATGQAKVDPNVPHTPATPNVQTA